MEPTAQNGVPTLNSEKMNSYIIRPPFDQKFKPSLVKSLLGRLLKERLSNVTYSSEQTHDLCISLSDEIKDTLKAEMPLERYRYLVQVILGEQRGQGVKVAYRSYWDSDTDNYAEYIFTNDSIFCVATAFGVYSY